MRPNPQFPADLVTFTEESLNGKLHSFVQRNKHFGDGKTFLRLIDSYFVLFNP